MASPILIRPSFPPSQSPINMGSVYSPWRMHQVQNMVLKLRNLILILCQDCVYFRGLDSCYHN